MTRRGPKTRRPPRDTSWQLLRDMRGWLDKVMDYPHGAAYLNGDGDKYPGDGWQHAEHLHKRLTKYLTMTRR